MVYHKTLIRSYWKFDSSRAYDESCEGVSLGAVFGKYREYSDAVANPRTHYRDIFDLNIDAG